MNWKFFLYSINIQVLLFLDTQTYTNDNFLYIAELESLTMPQFFLLKHLTVISILLSHIVMGNKEIVMGNKEI